MAVHNRLNNIDNTTSESLLKCNVYFNTFYTTYLSFILNILLADTVIHTQNLISYYSELVCFLYIERQRQRQV